MLVVDASAVAELLLGRPLARSVETHVDAFQFDLHAPQLLDIEVLDTVRRAVGIGAVARTRGGEAVEDLIDLPIERHPHGALLPRVWELRDNFSAYDASYLALAEALADATVLTADRRFARAIRHHATVPVIEVS